MKFRVFLLALGLIGAATAQANPVEWKIEDGGNGHWYQYVDSTVTWLRASEIAAAHSGYLATVTSSAENTFINSLSHGGAAWLGASDSDIEGVWKWVDGPEAGTNLTWFNWDWRYAPEPNNCCEGEDYLQFNWDYAGGGLWNDNGGPGLNSNVRYEFVVEFWGDPVPVAAVPEPETYASILAGLGLLGAFVRRNRTSRSKMS